MSPAAGNAASWNTLLSRLEADGFERSFLDGLFRRAAMRYDPAPMRSKLRVLRRKYFGPYRTRRAQGDLTRLGYTVGKIDGVYGAKTARAIKAYQKARGLDADGVPSDALLAALDKDLKRVPKKKWSSRVYKAARNPMRLAEAREFVIAHWHVFRAMQERYAVPWPVVAGILTVETRVGHFLGTRSPLVTLASMAACDDLACAGKFFRKGALSAEQRDWLQKTVRKRSRWAYDELKALLTYCARNKFDPLNMPGSIYGAFGIGQFMPSSVLRFGVDGDMDGDVDLFSVPDAVCSVGAYLQGHGWKGEVASLGKKRTVLFAYNHSQQYVNSVLEVAAHLERAFALKERSADGVRTVRVRTVSGLLRALSSDTRVLLAPGEYDFSQVPELARGPIRAVHTAAGLVLELTGLRNLRIEAPRGARLTAGGRGFCLRFTDVRTLQLDGLRLESGAKGTALLEFHRAAQVLVAHCMLRGGGLRCARSQDVRMANTLVHSVSEPGVRLESTRRMALQNVVMRAVRAKALLRIRNSPDFRLAECYFYDNGGARRSGALFEFVQGGTGGELRNSCLLDNHFARFSTRRGQPRTRNNYLRGNTFRAP